ncbi:helix-turn-helix domain-containing protein [Streptomyces mobaraensis NBRC 13819 = DSM 40847]|nr:Scr1 family TA system antitoxin-like transcriptional regulator [Streptomyces mobaraensis]QTT74774.1 helix-turn-helix domain-containing protein [Streptomyces mobaraensis NBRC 13819 = DSM 40847]
MATVDTPRPAAVRAAGLVVGAYLQHLRILRGWHQEDAARVLGCSISTVSRLEGGQVFTRRHARVLIRHHYGVPKKCARAVGELVRVRDYAEQVGDMGPGWHDRLALCEQRAEAITTYTATVIPVPLRTPAYHRALAVTGASAFSAPERIPRQFLDNQVHTLFLDSAVLERPVGGGLVMAEQIDHLLRLAWEGRAAVRVVPSEAGTPVGEAHLSRLTLQGSWLYVRESIGAVYTAEVASLPSEDPFVDALARVALTADRSHQLLVRARKHMDMLGSLPPREQPA